MSSNYSSIFADFVESKFEIKLDIQYPFCPSRYVIFGILFYVATIAIFQPSKDDKSASKVHKNSKRKFGVIELIIFIHNLVLAVFSVLCFINTAPIVYQLFATKGFELGTCDFHTLYDPEISSFGFWVYLFYLSKYWEFIDTFIVIARGRKPIFLQEYHHIGAVIAMWLITVTRSNVGYLFIVENSFIHSIMYSYYALSVIGIKFPLKNWITSAQIIQFTTGIAINGYQLFSFSSCLSLGDILCCSYMQIYVICLLYLFVKFYQRTYKTKALLKKA